jgi:toxin YoeB
MTIEFTSHAWEEFSYWMETEPGIALKIKELLKSIKQSPFAGLGKPEPLKFEFAGHWSRRITDEHRLVYRVIGIRGVNQKCVIVQCRYHYDK